jgi:nucleoporin NUP2
MGSGLVVPRRHQKVRLLATPPTFVFSSGFGGSTFTRFGALSAKPAEASGFQEDKEEVGGSAIAASDVVNDSKSLPAKKHYEEDEGEEEEETVHTTKSKVYKLHKK